MWESTDFIGVSVRRNTVTPVGFEIWDVIADKAADLSGYAIACKISTADGQAVLATINASNLNPPMGSFDINFNGTVLNTAVPNGTKEIVNLSMQIIATSSAEAVTVASGVIILKPGIN